MFDLHDLALRLLFEKFPVLRLLDGYKTQIGDLTTSVGALLTALAAIFPQYAPLHLVAAKWVAFSGLVISTIGRAHSDAKDRAGE